MKWTPELNGQGTYWWAAETPLGPVYAEFEDSSFPLGWHAYWDPREVDRMTTVGRFRTEDEAKDAAEKWIKALARKESKRLATFARGKK